MTKNLVSAALVALVVSLVVGVVLASQSSLGSVRNAKDEFAGGLSIGPAGSDLVEVVAKTCNLIGSDSSQAASTTVAYDCAVTGVSSGDLVFAQLASTTPAFGGTQGWAIVASKASTTANFVTVLLGNFSGAARVPSVFSVGSSTQIFVADTSR